MTTAVDLLERGYFPRELPPPFTTKHLAAFMRTNAAFANGYNRWTKCADHNLARAGTLRRALRIPNPVSQVVLARQVEQTWETLAANFGSGRFSASRPRVTQKLGRAVVPRIRHADLPKLRAYTWLGCKYILKTDLSQFYPTLYTHCVPWALHGKDHAKANIDATVGDAIDGRLRCQQDGQTSGIPIGPDTSFVVAETVLAAADRAFLRETGRVHGFRHVDDYELSFRTLGEAENALVILQQVLANFQLSLNSRKTSISEGPVEICEPWSVTLRTFPIRGTPGRSIADTMDLFSRALELARVYPGQAVLRYALMRMRDFKFSEDAHWWTLEALLLHAASVDTSTLPVVLAILSQNVQWGRKIRPAGLEEVLEATILRHAPLGHGSEVAWALWGAIQFEINLADSAARAVSRMDDDVVALLALDAEQRGRFRSTELDKGMWTRLVSLPDSLQGEHWLLAYESGLKTWLECPPSNGVPIDKLRRSSVSFDDTGAMPSGFTFASMTVPGGTLDPSYA